MHGLPNLKKYRKRHKTNNTKNTKIHRTTQKIHRATQLGRVRAVPRICGFYPGICLTTEEKVREKKNSGTSNKKTYKLLSYSISLTNYKFTFISWVHSFIELYGM